MTMIPTYYTIPEIATMLKCDESTVRRWISSGELIESGLTKRNRTVEESELLRFIKSRNARSAKQQAVNLQKKVA